MWIRTIVNGETRGPVSRVLQGWPLATDDPALGVTDMRDIATAFDQGRLAALDASGSCPFYPTSDCANAWHAGRAYETRRPSVYGHGAVRTMRRNRIGVADSVGFPATASRNAPIIIYHVQWNDGVATVTRES